MTGALDTIALALLAIAGVLAVARVVRTGSIADKLLGADLLAILVACGVAAAAGATGTMFFLDLVVIVSLLGFLASVTVARFIEKRGARTAGDDW